MANIYVTGNVEYRAMCTSLGQCGPARAIFMHEEINDRIACGNRCYYSIMRLFKSKLLSRNSKTLLYHSYLRPIITYASETWSLTKGDSKRLMTFERKVLRNIYGPKFDAESQTYERRNNQELQELYNRPNIIAYIRSKRLEWFGHVWRAGGQVIKEVLINTINKKRPLGRPRTRWVDVIAQDIKNIEEASSFDDAYDREKWRGRENGNATKIQFHLTSCGHIFCENCSCFADETLDCCKYCRNKCSSTLIGEKSFQTNPQVLEYFQEPEEVYEKLLKVMKFQKAHRELKIAKNALRNTPQSAHNVTETRSISTPIFQINSTPFNMINAEAKLQNTSTKIKTKIPDMRHRKQSFRSELSMLSTGSTASGVSTPGSSVYASPLQEICNEKYMPAMDNLQLKSFGH
ncbi:hypothetical protein AGLY_016112, partial [Aphis glycines]